MELADSIEIQRVDDVYLRKGPRNPQSGSLSLIGHHLIFSPNMSTAAMPAKSNGYHAGEIWLLHRAIDQINIESLNKDDPTKGGKIVLRCKNFLTCIFEVNKLHDCSAIARSITNLSNLGGLQREYPFYYRCPFTILDDGWFAFNAEEEFARLTVQCKDRWRISSVNCDYRICKSYPDKVIVPKGIGDDYLRISATFRDGGRFPVLCYYHCETRSCIIRCGQPLIGPTNRRCKEDESILNSFLSTTSKGIILDTRSKSIATGSKNKGGGCESQLYYSQWKYAYACVPSITEIRDALIKLVEICDDSSTSCDRWLYKLGSSGWLQAVAQTVTSAATAAQCVHCSGNLEVPVVVHGGCGTDSTLLVTSISQLLLDSDSRTIRGFQSLIEREWINAGHPFQQRCAHSAYGMSSAVVHESPVFLLFLDCIWQIFQQFPCSFEFTEEFLIFLFEHAYASEFGSFLGNNEYDKHRFEVKRRTCSLWSYVNNPEIMREYVNALYEPNRSVLWPSVAPQSIVLWERLYFRWQRDWKQMVGVKQTITSWKVKEKELQSKVLLLKRQIMELYKDAVVQN